MSWAKADPQSTIKAYSYEDPGEAQPKPRQLRRCVLLFSKFPPLQTVRQGPSKVFSSRGLLFPVFRMDFFGWTSRWLAMNFTPFSLACEFAVWFGYVSQKNCVKTAWFALGAVFHDVFLNKCLALSYFGSSFFVGSGTWCCGTCFQFGQLKMIVLLAKTGTKDTTSSSSNIFEECKVATKDYHKVSEFWNSSTVARFDISSNRPVWSHHVFYGSLWT